MERSPEYYYIYPVSEAGSVGDDMPISRALVSRMIAHILEPSINIYSMDNYINFRDVDLGDWYFPYINAVYHHGIIPAQEPQALYFQGLRLFFCC